MHKTEQMLADAEVTDEFRDETQRELAMLAILGKDTEDFLHGDIGRFVVGAAIQDQREIEQKLVILKPNTPWRRRRMVELQQRHVAIGMAVEWLRDAVVVGKSSLAALKELDALDDSQG